MTLPNGVYFCTLKENNGANDKASELDRDGVFRLSIGIAQNLMRNTLAVNLKGHLRVASLIPVMISQR